MKSFKNQARSQVKSIFILPAACPSKMLKTCGIIDPQKPTEQKEITWTKELTNDTIWVRITGLALELRFLLLEKKTNKPNKTFRKTRSADCATW